MGIQVDTGDWNHVILPGTKNITITGKNKNGDIFTQSGYTTVSGKKPAIFLKKFFQ